MDIMMAFSVCMFICMHVRSYVCMFICMHVRSYACSFICMFVHIDYRFHIDYRLSEQHDIGLMFIGQYHMESKYLLVIIEIKNKLIVQ